MEKRENGAPPVNVGSEEVVKEESWLNFAQETTLHGLRIAGSPSVSIYRRLTWIILLLAAFVYLLYTGVLVLMRFTNPDFITDVTLDFTYFRGKRFPSVTICNLNQFRASFLIQEPAASVLYPQLMVTNLTSTMRINDIHQATSDGPTASLYLNASHQLEDAILAATFGGREINITEHFATVFTDFGVCFEFNGKEKDPLYVSRPGSGGALSLYLDVQLDEYVPSGNVLLGEGFKVAVHDYDQAPTMHEVGFFVPPEKSTFVAILGSRNIHDPRAKEKCVNTSDPGFINTLKYHPKYTFHSCLKEIMIDFVTDRCGCKVYTNPGDAKICFHKSEMKCLKVVMAEVLQHIDKWPKQCPLQCEYTTYKVSASQTKFPPECLVKDRYTIIPSLKPVSDEYFKKNIIRLDIYFTDLMAVITKQFPEYNIIDAGGDLGGYMGLMFGASLLTIVEILEFFALTFISVMKKMNKKQTRVHNIELRS